MKKLKPPKPYSCKMECKKHCCGYVVLKTVMPFNIKYDEQYFRLRGMEFKQEEFDMTHIKRMLDDYVKEGGYRARILRKTMLSLLDGMFRQYAFRIPIKCEWIDEKTGLCKHYEQRPDICKRFGGNSPSFPTEGCPY